MGLALLPSVRMHATLLLLTAANLIIGFVAVGVLDPNLGHGRRVGFIATGTIAWGLVICLSPTKLPAEYLQSSGTLVAFREGASSFVAVVQGKSSLRLEMGRMWQGKKGRGYQGMAAHLPMHLVPATQDLLVVGMGKRRDRLTLPGIWRGSRRGRHRARPA